jgi:NTE family protein
MLTLSAVNFVNRLIDEDKLRRGTGPGEFRRLRLHRIVMEEMTPGVPGSMSTGYESFEMLHKLGQRATRRFLDAHFNDVGRKSTIDSAVQEARPELME